MTPNVMAVRHPAVMQLSTTWSEAPGPGGSAPVFNHHSTYRRSASVNGLVSLILYSLILYSSREVANVTSFDGTS